MKKIFKTLIFVFVFLFLLRANASSVWAESPTIGAVTTVPLNTTSVEKYAKFEVRFNVTSAVANLNPYFPYDPTTTTKTTWATVPDINWNWKNVGLTGINVDMLVSQDNFATSKDVPCFYYQPVEEVGPSSTNLFLEPVGPPDWRCRYAPEKTGTYQYKITAADAGGTAAPSAVGSFTATNPAPTSPTRHGFVETNLTDPNLSGYDSRFFTFSDGTPFVWPLVTYGFNVVTSQNPKLSDLGSQIQKLRTTGIRFIRWFPTDEGGGLFLFGGSVHNVWQNISGYSIAPSFSDTSNGNLFGYKPGDYSAQYFPAKANSTYLMTIRAKVTGTETLKFGLTDAGATNFLAAKVICSSTNTSSGCDFRQDGWNTYTLTYQNGSYKDVMGVRLFGSVNPPDKGILVGVVKLQRDENGTWGSNLVSHGDPDTYRYVDQIHAAYLDEIFKQSEQNGVYQKLTLFHKNDDMLNYFDDNGNYTGVQNIPWNFYSSKGKPGRWIQFAYARYFIARYSYSTALHSLEQSNENDPGQFEPGGELAKYISSIAPRHVLMSNSYWVYLNPTNWTNADYGQYFDYADKHWYANHDMTTTDSQGHTIPKICSWSTDETADLCGGSSNFWQDTVYNVRYIYLFFRSFGSGSYHYQKPIVRGETGIATTGTQPPDTNVFADTTGTYYHKKVWSHVGILGYLVDGEWYPNSVMYPSYKAYDAYISSETTLNNGTHVEIGTDNMQINTTSCSSGDNCIVNVNSNLNLRAFGSKDPQTKRVLVWVDNKNNTWTNNPGGASAQSGTFMISGMPNGSYTKEEWDTRTGTYTTTANYKNVTNGQLSLDVSGITTDKAYKLYIPGGTQPTLTPTPACGPPGDIDCSGHVSALDLSRLLSRFGETVPAGTPEDIDGSLKVNSIDLTTLLSNFGL